MTLLNETFPTVYIYNMLKNFTRKWTLLVHTLYLLPHLAAKPVVFRTFLHNLKASCIYFVQFQIYKPAIYRKTGLSLGTINLHSRTKSATLLPHISQIFAVFEPHYSQTLPHTCNTLNILRKVWHFIICEILPHLIVASACH